MKTYLKKFKKYLDETTDLLRSPKKCGAIDLGVGCAAFYARSLAFPAPVSPGTVPHLGTHPLDTLYVRGFLSYTLSYFSGAPAPFKMAVVWRDTAPDADYGINHIKHVYGSAVAIYSPGERFIPKDADPADWLVFDTFYIGARVREIHDKGTSNMNHLLGVTTIQSMMENMLDSIHRGECPGCGTSPSCSNHSLTLPDEAKEWLREVNAQYVKTT